MARPQNTGAGVDPALYTTPETEVAPNLQAEMAKLLAENAALRKAAVAAEVDNSDKAADSSHASSKERWGITVDEGSGQHDLQQVPVQVNGRAYQITRGAYVEVPKEVVSVLNDAIVAKAVSVTDDRGMPAGIVSRPSRRFPFQNHGMVIDATGKRIQESRA